MDEARNFKFATLLGFSKMHHKMTSRGKMGLAAVLGSSLKLGVPLYYLLLLQLPRPVILYLVCSLGLQMSIIK